MRSLPISACALGATALSAAAYGAWEARQYTLREVSVPVLPSGSSDIRVLHLSDIHMTPDQRRKQDWLRSLAELAPDLVINTGDNLAHRRSVPVVLSALSDLLDVPGVYVFGSNDYFEPTMRNPFRYLLPDNGRRHTNRPHLPWRELRSAFDEAGWVNLTNGFGSVKVGATSIGFAGVDDPHLRYDKLDAVAGPADQGPLTRDDVRLAVAHAPYLRVLDQFARDGYDAIIAGHTHGGQVCLPRLGALTTNCDLEPARAKGLHRHPADSLPGDDGSTWMHVSAGLGTNPFVRVRVACRPEATLLTLTARR